MEDIWILFRGQQGLLSPVEGRRLNHQTAWEALNLIVEPPGPHPLPEGRLPFDEEIVKRWRLSDLIMVS
jgi:hypothetical protein